MLQNCHFLDLGIVVISSLRVTDSSRKAVRGLHTLDGGAPNVADHLLRIIVPGHTGVRGELFRLSGIAFEDCCLYDYKISPPHVLVNLAIHSLR